MSFIGSINDKCRKFFATHAGLLDGRDVYIGCSGNFSLEQILTNGAPSARLYANDVSLYSSILGHLLAERPFRLESVDPAMLWLNDYLHRGPVEQMAVVTLLTTMLQFEKCKNPYEERMWQHYLANFDSYFAATCEKVRKVAGRIRIADYTMTDVHDFYPRPAAVSVGFLPTYVGGYERMFKRLDAIMDWDRPGYQMLTTEHLDLITRRLQENASGYPEMLYGAALVIAQGIRYCKADIKTGGVLKQAVDAFLSVPPEKPTVQKLETLINKLLAVLYPLRLRRIHDGEMDVWQVI